VVEDPVAVCLVTKTPVDVVVISIASQNHPVLAVGSPMTQVVPVVVPRVTLKADGPLLAVTAAPVPHPELIVGAVLDISTWLVLGLTVPATRLVIVPKLVNEDAVTPAARVAPESVPAGATTGLVVAAVTRPLPVTVMAGIAVPLPHAPVLVLTVARVVPSAPAVVVKSPVSAGN
jgi:hypothetical protein